MPERTTHSTFAARLKAARLAADLSQEQLAERAGVTHGTISRFETGKMTPLHETLEALAVALNVPMASLMSEAELAALARTWSRIAPSLRPQAMRVLESFAEYVDDSPKPKQPRRSPKKKGRRDG